jgi:SSS family solute:Na+ symporter
MDKKAIVLFVCCLYFLVLIIAGVYVSAKNKKTSDFLLAGRKLNLPFSIATLSAVQIGAGIILGGSANGAQMGVWMWYALSCISGLIQLALIPEGRQK